MIVRPTLCEVSNARFLASKRASSFSASMKFSNMRIHEVKGIEGSPGLGKNAAGGVRAR